MAKKPLLLLFTGPVGVGKSQLIKSYEAARSIGPVAPLHMTTVSPSRSIPTIIPDDEVVWQIYTNISLGIDFTIDTNFTDKTTVELIEHAETRGYEVQVHFVGCQLGVQVSRDGYMSQIQMEQLREKSLNRLYELSQLSDDFFIYDNSTGLRHQALVLRYFRHDNMFVQYDDEELKISDIKAKIHTGYPRGRARMFEELYCRKDAGMRGAGSEAFTMPGWVIEYFFCPILDLQPDHFGLV